MMKGGRILLIAALSLALAVSLFYLVSASGTVPTKINVTLSPPVLLKNIPNQTWAANTNLMNAFKLNDYFEDPNGFNLTYTATNPGNISVVISPNSSVSFYPNSGYEGTETVVFNASDGYLNASSNVVSLNVGFDHQAPRWYNPAKIPAIVYQNAFINFTTLWTDNFALANFTFSINQGSGWKNFSESFSGVRNTSLYDIQISAAANKTVSWYYCASDTSNNQNCTNVQNFMVSTQPLPPSQNITVGNNTYIPPQQSNSTPPPTQEFNFSTQPIFFKISLKQGSSTTRILKISNIGTSNTSFSLSLSSVNKFVVLSDTSFLLPFGTSKDITVDFKAGRYDTPGEYFGAIVIRTDTSGTRNVPVVIDLNPFVLDFVVSTNVSQETKRVRPGHDVVANISVDNLRDLPNSNITLYYAIKDFSGTIYNSSQENVTLKNHVSLERSLEVPQGTPLGNYIFYVRGTLGNFSTIDSDTFVVGSLFDFAAIFKYGSIVSAIFILSSFSMILFVKYRRERRKERLLNLYLMLTELKKLIKQGSTEQALDLYVRIKSAYGEHVSKTALQNREKLREEIDNLSSRLQKEVESESPKTQNEIKQASGASSQPAAKSSPAAKGANPAPSQNAKAIPAKAPAKQAASAKPSSSGENAQQVPAAKPAANAQPAASPQSTTPVAQPAPTSKPAAAKKTPAKKKTTGKRK